MKIRFFEIMKQMEFHVWALELVNVLFETTYVERKLTPDRFIMVPRLGFCEKRYVFLDVKNKTCFVWKSTTKVAPDVLIVTLHRCFRVFVVVFVGGVSTVERTPISMSKTLRR